MKITGVKLYKMDIPLITPFKTALRTVNAIGNLVVELNTDEGIVGYGEAPATAVITGDTLPSIAGAITQFILPKIRGLDVLDMDQIHNQIEKAMVHNTSAKAAVEIAAYDLMGKACAQPLYKVLGGARDKLETDITISVNDVATMVADSLAATARGFSILKIKVGNDVRMDLERLTAIRQAVGMNVMIRVDANQGWDARQSVRIIRAIEDANVNAELVEQPVPAHDLAGLAHVTANVDTPILADEAVFSVCDAAHIITSRAADFINIKLMKTGGIYNAMTIASLAQAYGVRCMMGCMLEGNVAVSAAAHVALARDIITMIDLDGPALCLTNPVHGGAQFAQSTITMDNDVGLGISGIDGLTPYDV